MAPVFSWSPFSMAPPVVPPLVVPPVGPPVLGFDVGLDGQPVVKPSNPAVSNNASSFFTGEPSFPEQARKRRFLGRPRWPAPQPQDARRPQNIPRFPLR